MILRRILLWGVLVFLVLFAVFQPDALLAPLRWLTSLAGG